MTFVLARPRSTLSLAFFTTVGLLTACDHLTTAPSPPARFTPEVTSTYLTSPAALKYRFGDRQGEMDGVPIYWNSASGAPSTEARTAYGSAYQCVEFVRRYYGTHYRETLPSRNAADYWTATMPGNLRRVANGGFELPGKGDIIVMADANRGPGHIAIVRSASRTHVRIAQQNHLHADLALTVRASSRGGTPQYEVGAITGRRTLGWFSRRTNAPLLVPQIHSVAPAKPKTSTRAQRFALATAGVTGAVTASLYNPSGKVTTFKGAAINVTPGGVVFQPTLSRTGTWSVTIESGGLVSNPFAFSVAR